MSDSSRPRRPLRLAATVVGLLVAVPAAWLGLSAALGVSHARQVETALESVQQAVAAGDTVAAADQLDTLQRHVAGARRWLGGAPWTLLAAAPVIGDTVAGTGTVVRALDSVTSPLVPAAAAVLRSGVQSVPDAALVLKQQQAGFIASARAAEAAAAEVAAIDAGTLLGPASETVTRAQEGFEQASPGLAGLAAASVLLPELLGVDEPSRWLLAAAQPAEARGSGAGFFGAYGVMQGEAGQISMLESQPNNDVFERPADLSHLPPEFAALWGDSAAYIWGHNLTRHFPYAAQLLAESTGTEPQFVVALDPRVVAGLLELTGPVTAAGVTIDAANAESYLTNGIYRQFPDGDAKDDVALALMAEVLAALKTTGAMPSEMLDALAEPVSQQRLVAWAADPAQQEVIERSVVAGALPDPPLTLTAALNNAGGNKLDAYLISSVAVGLTGCGADAAGSVSVDLDLADIPAGLPRYVVNTIRGPESYGGTRLLVHIYGPPGAQLRELTVDGAGAPMITGVERGRPVWGTQVDVEPGAPRNVTATFAGPLPAGELGYLPQPMINDTSVELRDNRTCV